ncbi:MAG TPA: hypothetical protein VES68_03575 [Candidatus Sulfotelmatobacter sp.]|nr:hypothetical protein [Candidatus Sulfotelmatobacter sp.]
MTINSSKSAHGNTFKDSVLDVLKSLKNEGILEIIQIGKRFGQFYTTFLVTYKGNIYAIFTTTSARSDRIKENQWDAWGIKNYATITTFCLVLLPDYLTDKEFNSYISEKNRIKSEGYISKIDDIIQLKDLKNIFIK